MFALYWLSTLSLIVLCSCSSNFKYTYDKSDPPKQTGDWNQGECNTGKRQSPINIAKDKTIKTSMPPLKFHNYDSVSEFNVTNNGHTVQVTPTGAAAKKIQLTGGNLNGVYNLAQLHFHWGGAKGYGSEHQVEGEPFDLEVHFVHTQDKVSDQSSAGDYIAVVGVFLIESEDASEDDNPFLKLLSTKFPKFEKTEQIKKNIDLTNLLPSNQDDFYRYMGSLTTPLCTETVVWTLMKNTIKVSPEIMKRFRKVEKNKEGVIHDGNYRGVQKLNSRPVFERLADHKDAHLFPKYTCGAPRVLHVGLMTIVLALYAVIFS